MTGMAMMQILIRMSIQGSIIVGIVWILRMVFRGLRISYRYCVLLWGIVFFYLIFPWKIENEHGFWRAQPESMVVAVSADGPTVVTGLGTGIVLGQSAVPEQNVTPGQSTLPEQMNGTDATTVQGTNFEAGSNELPVTAAQSNGTAVMPFLSAAFTQVIFAVRYLWLAGIPCFLAYFIFSYVRMKHRLAECLPGEEGVRYVDGIRTPMVFGILRPQIYLPMEMKPEFYDCVLQHERIHLHRRDYLWKILTYLISIVHWMNPVVWLAYYLLCCDIEKACDEAVTEHLEPEDRQEYAAVLLSMATDTTARRIFAAPVCFDEGDIRGRIRHILKCRKTAGKLAALAVELCIIAALVLLTQKSAVSSQKTEEDFTEMVTTEETGQVQEQNLPTIYIQQEEELQAPSPFRIENYYITERVTAYNHYYIDNDGILWGNGYNENGQLGTGSYETDFDKGQFDDVRIADHVVSVDADWNNNFCIYLTEDGNLYGLGLNMAGLLLGKDTVKQVYSDMDNDRVCTPTLLMKNVRYARAGREAIIVLKEDGAVYWWGQLRTTSSTTVGGYDEYWSVTENPLNLVKMMYLEPHKVLDHCIYVDINAWNGAAITEDGELYLWGLNIFGQCGVSKSENVHDFVREPQKVLDKVSMVWLGGIRHSDDARTFDADISAIRYGYNNFALLEDGMLLGAGDKLGKDSVTTVMEGDLDEAGSHRCSFSFVPVKAVVYSLEYNREVLSRMQWGMQREEVRALCTDAGLQCDVASENASLYIENSKYYCYFDENGGLDRIQIQAGSSRDGRFLVDKTTLEELQRNIADADDTLTQVKSVEEDSWERWQYEDMQEQIRYYFTVYEGIVTVIEEEQMINEEATK